MMRERTDQERTGTERTGQKKLRKAYEKSRSEQIGTVAVLPYFIV